MYIEPDIAEKVKKLTDRNPKTIHDSLGITLTHISKSKVVATMRVDHRTHQPFGIMHGGASVVIAESVASIGAWVNLDKENQMAVGIEINANHIKSVSGGVLTAEGVPVHIGKTTQVWQVKILDEQQRLICISRCTLAVKENKI